MNNLCDIHLLPCLFLERDVKVIHWFLRDVKVFHWFLGDVSESYSPVFALNDVIIIRRAPALADPPSFVVGSPSRKDRTLHFVLVDMGSQWWALEIGQFG